MTDELRYSLAAVILLHHKVLQESYPRHALVARVAAVAVECNCSTQLPDWIEGVDNWFRRLNAQYLTTTPDNEEALSVHDQLTRLHDDEVSNHALSMQLIQENGLLRAEVTSLKRTLESTTQQVQLIAALCGQMSQTLAVMSESATENPLQRRVQAHKTPTSTFSALCCPRKFQALFSRPGTSMRCRSLRLLGKMQPIK